MIVATLSCVIRLLGTDDRGSPVDPESIYNLVYGNYPGWTVIRITGTATLVVIAPDGTGLEVR